MLKASIAEPTMWRRQGTELKERREKLELSINHAIHIRRYTSTLATRLSAVMTWASSFIDWKRAIVTKSKSRSFHGAVNRSGRGAREDGLFKESELGCTSSGIRRSALWNGGGFGRDGVRSDQRVAAQFRFACSVYGICIVGDWHHVLESPDRARSSRSFPCNTGSQLFLCACNHGHCEDALRFAVSTLCVIDDLGNAIQE